MLDQPDSDQIYYVVIHRCDCGRVRYSAIECVKGHKPEGEIHSGPMDLEEARATIWLLRGKFD
jgi:hypothetical protein